MDNNEEFLQTIQQAFHKYLQTSSRSNEKLIILHGKISNDLQELLPDYTIQSLGIGDGKEQSITGRYLDKKVDIKISKDNKTICGIAVKYVMSNYSQNSNNYFENMLGETANIRSFNIPYFQILILQEKMPYFKDDGTIAKIEEITEHNIDKYVKLSNDNADNYMHTPNKTLLVMTKIPDIDLTIIKTKQDYINNYKNANINYSNKFNQNMFGANIILNDYKLFLEKIVYYIKSL